MPSSSTADRMSPEPPVPSHDPSPDSVELIDRETGEPVPSADMREEFARLSASADPEAERAFIESKLDMIRTHPILSAADREAAIAELREKLRRPPGPTGPER